jgi:hypothetical protein
MAESTHEPMLVIAADTELRPADRIWGYGGWLPPEERPPEWREALDWLTLGRICGWDVAVRRRTATGLDGSIPEGVRWIIVACDPDALGEAVVAGLAARLETEPVLLIARAATAGSPVGRLAGIARADRSVAGQDLCWQGPGPQRRWYCRAPLEAGALDLQENRGVAAWATLEGAPLIAARRIGRGTVVTLGLHPSAARDADGSATALLRQLLVWGATTPTAWLDLEGCLVLRMDDPGGSQNVHYKDWLYPKIAEAAWTDLAADLKRRKGRLSIGYVAGWVDDGDSRRGKLEVANRQVERVAGAIYPSPQVKYQDLDGDAPGTLHDYESEYRGIQALRVAGLGDVELHGYTHLHPDTAVWAAAADRYEATSWYRELGHGATATIAARAPEEHPLALGMAAIRRHFGITPTTLICPGDQWTDAVIERALALGLQLVSCYHVALRHGERFCWTSYIRAPYLDDPQPAQFDAGLPVVGYFHDREPALEGVSWVSRWLDRWQEAGAKRLLDFRELAAALGLRLRLDTDRRGLRLTITGIPGAPPLVRPLPVNICLPARPAPSHLTVSLEGEEIALPIHPWAEGVGQVYVPNRAGSTAWDHPTILQHLKEGEPCES